MLLVMDLDNTLLNRDKNITAYTVSVLKRCREKGHCIAFATARAENAMQRFIDAVLPDIIISNGGATIRVEGEIIYRNPMSAEEVALILEMCRGFTADKGLITVECEDGDYCNFMPADPDRRNAWIYSDFVGFEKPAYKITAELTNETWGEEIIRRCPNCTVIGFTGEIWRRFAAKHSDKETALKILLEYLGIAKTDVIAFGDDLNDLGMLKLSGTSVAVSNAIDAVKDVCDDVTDSNDCDGVAKFLDQKLL